jgi:hypothetical protein
MEDKVNKVLIIKQGPPSPEVKPEPTPKEQDNLFNPTIA